MEKEPTQAQAVSAALGEARRVRETLTAFLTKIKEQTPEGRLPWAVLCDPGLLQHFVTVLAFEHSNLVVARADTKVSAEEINKFLSEHGDQFGRTFLGLRKPAMWAHLFGVLFIAAAGIPVGSLVFVPAAEPEKVTVNGQEATSVGSPDS